MSCYDTAKRMLGVVELPSELHDRLLKVNCWCAKEGGLLRSRQVIAQVIEQWHLDGEGEGHFGIEKLMRRVKRLENLLHEARSSIGCHCSHANECGHDPDCINARISKELEGEG